ncbi:MAG: LPS export ABC transporter periplasmic protein LptC [Bacteroidota bacterium]
MNTMKRLLFGLLLLVACSSEEEGTAVLPAEADDQIRSESFGVEFVFSDSARLTTKLFADRVVEKAEREKEDDRPETVFYFPDGVRMEFYSKRSGAVTSTIRSDYGTFWQDEGLAELKGDVVLTNRNGEKLQTEQLFWSEDQDKIYTDQFVKVQTADKIITAEKGLVSNTEFTNYEFTEVTGIFEVDPNLVE